MLEIMPFEGGSIIVWGGISFTCHTKMHALNDGLLTMSRYFAAFLDPYVVSYAPYNWDGFILMHDNAGPHKSRCVIDYLITVQIKIFD